MGLNVDHLKLTTVESWTIKYLNYIDFITTKMLNSYKNANAAFEDLLDYVVIKGKNAKLISKVDLPKGKIPIFFNFLCPDNYI